MDIIKNQIDSKIYYIRIDTKKSIVLAKGNSKNETKNELKQLIKDNEFNNIKIYRIKIKIHKNMYFDDCILSFNLDNYKVKDKKLIKIKLPNQYGLIWFRKEWLLENGWDVKYISNCVNLLKKGKAGIKIPGINYYDLLGKN
jgi:hypothetical protein